MLKNKYFVVEDNVIIKTCNSSEEAYAFIDNIAETDTKRVQFHEFDIIEGKYL
jgi:hypothetical protein